MPLPSFPHRRRPLLLLLLGLLLGVVAPATVAAPASALPRAQGADPHCSADGFSLNVSPVPQAWTHVGTRSLGAYAYRHWMVQEYRGSTLPYLTSYVAKCSGTTLVSRTPLTTEPGRGTTACTSYTDINPPLAIYNHRYVGQRGSTAYGYISTVTFRYWQQVLNGGIVVTEPTSYVVMC